MTSTAELESIQQQIAELRERRRAIKHEYIVKRRADVQERRAARANRAAHLLEILDMRAAADITTADLRA